MTTTNADTQLKEITALFANRKQTHSLTRSIHAQNFYESWSNPKKTFRYIDTIEKVIAKFIDRERWELGFLGGRKVSFELDGLKFDNELMPDNAAMIVDIYNHAKSYNIPWETAFYNIKKILDENYQNKPGFFSTRRLSTQSLYDSARNTFYASVVPEPPKLKS